ncbi:MAG: hypothetical protein M1827_003959 [Pycnora praestabilis]|nr:MAG: hypothetical protein M1827_003959 [Pycnora praestabilis]
MVWDAVSDKPQVGLQHGKGAKTEIGRAIKFYKNLFQETAKLQWPTVCKTASGFLPLLERNWVPYVEEMKGVGQGAGVDFESILAMNVRTEIAYGMFNDGCTALSWKTSETSLLAQNWDWQHEQKENLIILHIRQHGKPSIHMITEAGIIGKIGLNSAGVGVCLNAIKAKGIDFDRLPVHLSLRAALDSPSRAQAVASLKNGGVASACHILVADGSGGTGLECSAVDFIELDMMDGKVTHTNNFVVKHAVDDISFLHDSSDRLQRIKELINDAEDRRSPVIPEMVGKLLEDEKDYPTSICRDETEKSTVATLFSIVMDLEARSARLRMGRPSAPDEIVLLNPE